MQDGLIVVKTPFYPSSLPSQQAALLATRTQFSPFKSEYPLIYRYTVYAFNRNTVYALYRYTVLRFDFAPLTIDAA